MGPDPMKTLCHSEKLILETVTRGMPTPDHNGLSHFWPGQEHSLHILLIWYLFAVLSYFWVLSGPHKHFWEALLCWPTNGPSLMLLILGWYVFHQGTLLPWPQLIGPRTSTWPAGNYLLVGQCPGRGAQNQSQAQWYLFILYVDRLESLS